MLRGSTANQFLVSFAARLAQLDKVSREGVLTPVTLSLLFSPTGYLSATQQHAARASKLSLELFRLVLDLGEKQDGLSYTLTGAISFSDLCVSPQAEFPCSFRNRNPRRHVP